MNQKLYCLTAKAKGLANIITTQTSISQAFDPKNTKGQNFRTFNGIWDTGATNTVITQRVVDECKLRPISMRKVLHAGGSDICEVYLVNSLLRNNVMVHSLSVTKTNSIGGDADVLIGMDIINQGDFAITNKDGNTTFSFRIPSVECIDFLKT